MRKILPCPSNVRSLMASLSLMRFGYWKFISAASPADMPMSTLEFERLKLSTGSVSYKKITFIL